MKNPLRPPFYFAFCFVILLTTPFIPAQDLPAVKVENIRRIFHNGEHNAFTDMIRWNGKLWLTFRSCPDGHMVFPTSRIIVLSSEDGKDWKQSFVFSVAQRDTRDPHFLAFKDKLFVFTGTWYSGDSELPREQYDLNKHLGYAVATEDGNNWSQPRPMEGTYGHYIWRAATDGETAYLCARRKRDYTEKETGAGGARIVESAMLESIDGWNWRFVSLFQQDQGNETAFKVLDDKSIVAVSREGSKTAQLAKSHPPYLEWERSELDEYIGGPLLAKWGDRWIVGGRRNTKQGPKTTLYWLSKDTLNPFAELPSGGDNSYPGFVEIDASHGLVSWYSSHEKDAEGNVITAIYLADITVE